MRELCPLVKDWIEKKFIGSFDVAAFDKLVCFGCAHSASGKPFPSMPSGERPCVNCVRNPRVQEEGPKPLGYGENAHMYLNPSYAGPLLKDPKIGDYYRSLDSRDLTEQWYAQQVAAEMLKSVGLALVEKHGPEALNELLAAEVQRKLADVEKK